MCFSHLLMVISWREYHVCKFESIEKFLIQEPLCDSCQAIPSRTRNTILKILRPRSCDRSENILNYS